MECSLRHHTNWARPYRKSTLASFDGARAGPAVEVAADHPTIIVDSQIRSPIMVAHVGVCNSRVDLIAVDVSKAGGGPIVDDRAERRGGY